MIIDLKSNSIECKSETSNFEKERLGIKRNTVRLLDNDGEEWGDFVKFFGNFKNRSRRTNFTVKVKKAHVIGKEQPYFIARITDITLVAVIAAVSGKEKSIFVISW